jgi:hypothetical protein
VTVCYDSRWFSPAAGTAAPMPSGRPLKEESPVPKTEMTNNYIYKAVADQCCHFRMRMQTPINTNTVDPGKYFAMIQMN